jgi:peroxiredoxin
MIRPGARAPEFALKDQNGKTVKLSGLAGKKVLLSFRPLAWTPVCHDQMKSLEDNHAQFDEMNAVALGIGVDSVPSNKAWAEAMGIKNTRLLSDFWPHGVVAKAYGILREDDGFSERANIVINEKGKVIFAQIYPVAQQPEIEEVLEILRGRRK